jgi:hypothetical protein
MSFFALRKKPFFAANCPTLAKKAVIWGIRKNALRFFYGLWLMVNDKLLDYVSFCLCYRILSSK